MQSISRIAGALLLAAMLAPSIADANGSRSGHGGGRSSHSATHSTSSHSTSPHSAHSTHAPRASSHTKATGVPRDSKGRIERSRTARNDFQKSHPCPSTGKSSGACPGYVVDHVTPLKRGGADHPSNMQWQTTQAAKIKDKTE